MTTTADYNLCLTYQAGEEPGSRVFRTVAGPATGARDAGAEDSGSGGDHQNDRTVSPRIKQGVLALLSKNELIQILLRIL